MNKYIQQSEKCNCHHQCGCDKGKCNCYPTPPHKEHGEWEKQIKDILQDEIASGVWCHEDITVANLSKCLTNAQKKLVSLLFSTQQEAVEKERKRVKEIVTNPPKDLVVKYGDYDDLDVWSVDWQRYILDSLTPKETI